MIDATGEDFKSTALGMQNFNSHVMTGYDLTWTAQTSGTQIQVKLDATFEKWFQDNDHFSGTVVLDLEQSFPDAKVTGPDEVSASYTVTGLIKPINYATITTAALDDIRKFWDSLSPETQDAITRNELPNGDPVYLDGYASTKGRIKEKKRSSRKSRETALTKNYSRPSHTANTTVPPQRMYQRKRRTRPSSGRSSFG